MRKVTLCLAAASILSISSTALAGKLSEPASQRTTTSNCWGVVSAQLAQVEGGIGQHSSSQETPRLGLGNVARLFYDMGLIESSTLSALGSFLASLDEYDETACSAMMQP